MENYLGLLRYIITKFDIKKTNEFDKIIKTIINKIFDEYYYNRIESFYRINLINKYAKKYCKIKKTDDVVKMIIRLNSDSKNAINKILKDHNYFHSFKEENINQITNYILKLKQKGYHRYIEALFFNKYLERINFELLKGILCDIYIKNLYMDE